MMSHKSPVQKQRAKRGRRRKRRGWMRPMEAYTPRIRREKHATVQAWRRRHPDNRKFGWQRNGCESVWLEIAEQLKEEME